MEAAAVAPPALLPCRSVDPSPAQFAARRGPEPWPRGRALAARRHAGAALRCEPSRRPEARPVARAAATEDAGTRRKRLAVFVSGAGSNFRAIHDAALGGAVRGDVAALVTDKPAMPEHDVDFVLLAGYLKLIPAELVREYPRSILNIHPSLLPAFGGKGYYGSKVHKAVIASGARYSGPTVHFVDEHYDTGKTLAQRVVPVLADDTPEVLAARVLHEEHQVYVEAVAALCEDRIVWREDGVPLIKSRTNPNEYT
ncbi:hypothetical protein ACP4OV_010148 [Aristida adscensionis]